MALTGAERARRYVEKYPERVRAASRRWNRANGEKINSRRYQRRGKLILFVREHKASRGCLYCHEKHPAVLDLHHRDPSAKKFTVAEGVRAITSLEKITAEIEKCDVICANCHRKLHAGVLSGVD
jgi:formate-dependent nitrite reductase cytochrome c552 subunit